MPKKALFKKHFFRSVNFGLFLLLLSLFPSENIYFKDIPQSKGMFIAKEVELPDPPDIPVSSTGLNPPDLTAEAILVLDINSGVKIYTKNEYIRLSPASTTKLMTALVVLDNFQLDDVFTVNSIVKGGRSMGLVKGEQLTVENLLYGALVHSANDAAYTIAANYKTGVAGFVQAMNDKAKILHLDNTRFSNPIGFDDTYQYTTAADLTKLAVVALSDKNIVKIVGTKSITVSDVNFTYFHKLENVNELLGKVAGLTGVKTGYTQNAGEVLVSEVKKNGHQILFVVLKSSDRFGETTQLINWVFENFTWSKPEKIIDTSLM